MNSAARALSFDPTAVILCNTSVNSSQGMDKSSTNLVAIHPVPMILDWSILRQMVTIMAAHPQDAINGLAADIFGYVDCEYIEGGHACRDGALWCSSRSVPKLDPLLIRLISRRFSVRSSPLATTEHRSPGRRRTDTTVQRHFNNGQLGCDHGRASWSYYTVWRIKRTVPYDWFPISTSSPNNRYDSSSNLSNLQCSRKCC